MEPRIPLSALLHGPLSTEGMNDLRLFEALQNWQEATGPRRRAYRNVAWHELRKQRQRRDAGRRAFAEFCASKRRMVA